MFKKVFLSSKEQRTQFNKNCSDYAMQFYSLYFITICHSRGHCCAPTSRREKVYQTVHLGHFTSELYKSNLRVCLCATPRSPCIINPSYGIMKDKETKMGHYQKILLYLDDLRI